MIKTNEFRLIDIEVQNAIQEAFEFAKANEKDKNDYYLFLCNASFIENYEGAKISPYVIDNRMDYLIDSHRIDFLTKYLKTYYSFSQFNTSDSKESLTMELMMYTHIWESKNFLKQLTKLLDLCNGNDYQWTYKIPDARNGDSKQLLIRDTLRDGFRAKSLKISKIITNGYRSQFRNAFAHSDYSFGLNDDKIDLHNYKPNSYEVPSIGIDEWTVFFCYSFLLNYYFQNFYYQERQKIESPIEVYLRNSVGDKKKGIIEYDPATASFTGNLTE
ncbi:hypothetical protein [Aquimarina sp. SS2-1]|uniref:hypothetical protein n=1 Tax=Aquimarina besae TaxID=3342247 RepID=UPI00366D0C09